MSAPSPQPGQSSLRGNGTETLAEVALVALTLATAFGFARLFVGWSFLEALMLAGLASHLLALGLRRAGLGMVASSLGSVAGLVLFVTLYFYRSVSWWGLPTRAVWDAAGVDLAASWEIFNADKAPVAALPGFLLAAVVGLWLAAYLADGFAFRARTGLEALLPTGIVFLFSSVLATDRLRLASAALWLGAAAVFLALHRAWRDESSGAWLTQHRRGAAPAALRVGGALTAVAVLAGLTVTPSLPGAGSEPLVETSGRGDGNSTRITVSPLVDIRGRLTERSDNVAFQVRADRPAYWRLTALEQFDGKIWGSERSFRRSDGTLSDGYPTDVPTRELTQQYTIQGLESVWLPAAYVPERIATDRRVVYDPESGSLVTASGKSQPGDTYTVVSELADLDEATLAAAQGPLPDAVAETYLAAPEGFSPQVTAVAGQVTAPGATRFDKARLLQDWFRTTFTYDLTVRIGHDTDAITWFLENRRGYCEQFAGAFAAMARSLGIPARVAVGFTYGEKKGDVYEVSGKHAHAWPEVWFNGIGWVLFEPTPPRGAPGAEAYTGAVAAQAGEPAPETTATTVSTGTTVPSVNGVDDGDLGLLTGLPLNPLDQSAGATSGGGVSWTTRFLVLLGLLALGSVLWVVGLPWLQRRRFARLRHAAPRPADRVLVAWQEVTGLLARSGSPPNPSDTPNEYARRAAEERNVPDVGLVRLAELVTAAAYSGGDLEGDAVGTADAVRDRLDRRLAAAADWRTRLRWRVDPGPLLHPVAAPAAGGGHPVREPEPEMVI